MSTDAQLSHSLLSQLLLQVDQVGRKGLVHFLLVVYQTAKAGWDNHRWLDVSKSPWSFLSNNHQQTTFWGWTKIIKKISKKNVPSLGWTLDTSSGVRIFDGIKLDSQNVDRTSKKIAWQNVDVICSTHSKLHLRLKIIDTKKLEEELRNISKFQYLTLVFSESGKFWDVETPFGHIYIYILWFLLGFPGWFRFEAPLSAWLSLLSEHP